MKPAELLDQRIAELGDWRGDIVAKLRQLVLEADPDITAEWKWGTAVWSHQGLVCAIGAFKDNAGLNFFQGASLKDPHKLFNAGLEAKKSRSVRFYESDKINEPALKDLIRAAVNYNLAGH
jgi:hypothetical protein